MAIEKAQRRSHTLNVFERTELRATGVTRIEYFSDETVVAFTDFGNIHIKGSSLYVDSLNAATGDLLIKGTINAVTYYERDEGKSWLKRVFR